MPELIIKQICIWSQLPWGFWGTSIIAAHAVAPDSYSWSKNTISDLAAQNYEHAWIMLTGLIGFGTLVSTAAIWDFTSERKHWSQTIPLMIYGTSMTMSGIFSTAHFEKGVSYSKNEAKYHSLFANLAGGWYHRVYDWQEHCGKGTG